MNSRKADELLARLAPTAVVVDIGGGASPFLRADYVIDGLAYEARGELDGAQKRGVERFTRETWTQLDLCARKPWPFPDRFFDFATCSHVLEDVRDPVWVCSEMRRIAKAGYIETPSRMLEQSRGIEHPLYAGFHHHRWLVTIDGNRLVFRQKPHSLHSCGRAIVAEVGVWRRLNPRYENCALEWQGNFQFGEELLFNEAEVNGELCAFAESCRGLADLTLPLDIPFTHKLKRCIYFWRMRRAARVGAFTNRRHAVASHAVDRSRS